MSGDNFNEYCEALLVMTEMEAPCRWRMRS